MPGAGRWPETEIFMTPQERQLLADLFERVRTNAAGPRDPEAEGFIGDAVRALPHAPYVLAQTTLVQQQALEAAAQRIAELEARVAQSAPAPAETSFLGNLGKSLFGGGPAASAPPPPRPSYDASGYQRGAAPDPSAGYRQPAYAPPPPAGPWGAPAAPSAGGGFLSNAMTTAAGVAGGIAVADLFQNLIGGRGGLFGGHSVGGFSGGETINNFYEAAPDAAGQHAQDVLQDMDQDQDDAQDAGWDNSDSGGDDS
jgi:hypothetical protein